MGWAAHPHRAGHPVQPLDVASRLVGRLRFAGPPALPGLRGRGRRGPRHRPAHGQGRRPLLRRDVPRGLRHDPLRPRRPAGRGRRDGGGPGRPDRWISAASGTTTRRSPRSNSPWASRASRRTSARSSTSPSGQDWEGYLATLDKKDRHEIRRKIRRAESAGSTQVRAGRSDERGGRDVHPPARPALGRSRSLPVHAGGGPDTDVHPHAGAPGGRRGPGPAAPAGPVPRGRPARSSPPSASTTRTPATSTTPAWTPRRRNSRRA